MRQKLKQNHSFRVVISVIVTLSLILSMMIPTVLADELTGGQEGETYTQSSAVSEGEETGAGEDAGVSEPDNASEGEAVDAADTEINESSQAAEESGSDESGEDSAEADSGEDNSTEVGSGENAGDETEEDGATTPLLEDLPTLSDLIEAMESVAVEWEGEGTAASPYLIQTADELTLLATRVNAGNTYTDSVFRLEEDIETRGTGEMLEEWTPIGTSTSAFAGTFDGNGKTVSIYINNTSSYQALFAYVSAAEIRDLTVDGSVTGCGYLAGIVANTAGATEIENCTNKAKITEADTTTVTTSYLGGIAANVAANAAITGCVNEGEIYSGSATNRYSGGIVGKVTDLVVISGCTNTAAVTAGAYAGGLVANGSTTTEVLDCTNTGAVTANYAGGISGNVVGSVARSYNTGTITADEPLSATAARYAGGLVGYSSSATSIVDSYNTGAVTVLSSSSTGVDSAAGLLAYSGTGASVVNSYNQGDVTGDKAARGIAYTLADSTITRCYNTGAVSSAGGNDHPIGSEGVAAFADCYYLSDGEEEAGLSADEMKGETLAGYLAFAFVAQENGYPKLYWEDEPGAATDHIVLNYQESEFLSYTAPDTEVRVLKSELTGGLPALTVRKAGVAFAGWYAEDGETQYESIDGLVNGAILYAKWTVADADSFRVTFDYGYYKEPEAEESAEEGAEEGTDDGQEDSGEAATPENTKEYETVLSGGTVSVRKLDARTGFTFAGWYQVFAADDAENRTLAGEPFDFSTAVTEDIYLIAVWQAYAAADYSWYTAGAQTFTIQTAAQLLGLARITAGEDGQTVFDFSDTTIYLEDDINLSDLAAVVGEKYLWDLPIGTNATTPFKGTFDGQGHTVSGLYISLLSEESADYQGLFGYVSSADIENFTLENADIKVENANGNEIYVGGAVGYAVTADTVISGITVSGRIWGGTYKLATYVGGIVGRTATSGIQLSNCVNHASVTFYQTGGSSPYGYVGGITGGYAGGNMTGCYNDGAVQGAYYVGGIAGTLTSATVSHCGNSGTVSGGKDWTVRTTQVCPYLGGIAGTSATDTTVISHCYNTGDLAIYAITTSTNTSNPRMGGIQGHGSGTIVFCYSTGDMLLDLYMTSLISSTAGYAGGITGYSSSAKHVIESSYSTGIVTQKMNMVPASGGVPQIGAYVGHLRSGTNVAKNSYSALKNADGAYLNTFGGANGTSYTITMNNAYLLAAASESGSTSGARTATEMRQESFAAQLGRAFQYNEGGYPTLRWEEEPDDNYVVVNYGESQYYTLGYESNAVDYAETSFQLRVPIREDGTIAEPEGLDSRAGFAADGWYYEDPAGTDFDAETAAQLNFETDTFDGGEEIFVKWKLAPVPLTYHLDYLDADGNEVTQVVEAEPGSIAIPYAPQREDYGLVGWYQIFDYGTEYESVSDTPFAFGETYIREAYHFLARWQGETVNYDWYTDWEGSEYYTITTAGELIAFARLVTGAAPEEVAAQALDFAGVTVKLDEDIDLPEDYVWSTPIGNQDFPFRGTFDGG